MSIRIWWIFAVGLSFLACSMSAGSARCSSIRACSRVVVFVCIFAVFGSRLKPLLRRRAGADCSVILYCQFPISAFSPSPPGALSAPNE